MIQKIREFISKHYPFFVVLILLLVSFHTWVFQWGILTSGDWPFYYQDFLLSFYGVPQIWTSYWGFGSVDVAAAFDLFKFLYISKCRNGIRLYYRNKKNEL